MTSLLLAVFRCLSPFLAVRVSRTRPLHSSLNTRLVSPARSVAPTPTGGRPPTPLGSPSAVDTTPRDAARPDEITTCAQPRPRPGRGEPVPGGGRTGSVFAAGVAGVEGGGGRGGARGVGRGVGLARLRLLCVVTIAVREVVTPSLPLRVTAVPAMRPTRSTTGFRNGLMQRNSYLFINLFITTFFFLFVDKGIVI